MSLKLEPGFQFLSEPRLSDEFGVVSVQVSGGANGGADGSLVELRSGQPAGGAGRVGPAGRRQIPLVSSTAKPKSSRRIDSFRRSDIAQKTSLRFSRRPAKVSSGICCVRRVWEWMRGRPPPRVERTMLRPWDETQEHRDNLEELMYKLRGEDGLGVPYEPEVRRPPNAYQCWSSLSLTVSLCLSLV